MEWFDPIQINSIHHVHIFAKMSEIFILTPLAAAILDLRKLRELKMVVKAGNRT